MKTAVVIGVFLACALIDQTMARCQGFLQECSLTNPNKNCCNGHQCKLWSPTERRCIPNDPRDCVRRGEECGLMKYCCGNNKCERSFISNKFVCRNQ